jgi:glucose/arabinose dehydrogenase
LSIALAAALLAGCAAAGQAAAPTAPLATVAPPTEAPAATAAAAEAPPAATETPPTTLPAPAATEAPPTPEAAQDFASLRLDIELLAEGFAQPTQVTHAGDGSGRLFVVEQAGRIWVLRAGERAAEPFLDLTELVGSSANEQGLLSVAFHPRFSENGLFYVNYTDRAGDTVVARYRTDAADGERADPTSAAEVLRIEQPAGNHNGGLLKFGPDGYLYIGTGDGGGAGDPDNHAQRLNTLLGKLLRIDIDGGTPYAVPADNPFVGQAEARPEIWAYGLRNPWRFAFDRASGDLYIADVGQSAQEEVHFQAAASAGGENYGWRIMEGSACYAPRDCDPSGLELPVAVYPHGSDEGGCSITGGYVYRGAQFPALAGVYVYTDYCSGNLWALRVEEGAWRSRIAGRTEIRASSFGEDEAGELYVADRDDGGIYRLVLAPPPPPVAWLPLVATVDAVADR